MEEHNYMEDHNTDNIQRPPHCRPPMPIAMRAAQFSSFAALRGHSQAIDKTRQGREAEYERRDNQSDDFDSWNDLQ